MELTLPPLSTYPKDRNRSDQGNVCAFILILVLFSVAGISKQSNCPLADKWIKKGVMCIY